MAVQTAGKPEASSHQATGPLYRLAYRSRSLIAADRSDAELAQILRTARARNSALKVTGALMLYQNWFAQILEGPEDAIKSLYDRIKTDARHDSVQLLEQGAATQRSFEKWAMAHVGEHGEADIPLMATGDGLAPAAAWRASADQEKQLTLLRQATRGYGLGS